MSKFVITAAISTGGESENAAELSLFGALDNLMGAELGSYEHLETRDVGGENFVITAAFSVEAEDEDDAERCLNAALENLEGGDIRSFDLIESRAHVTDDGCDDRPDGGEAGKRVVIHSAELGVFLGSVLGLGFWSKLDPVNLDVAPTFETEAAAKAFIADGQWPSDISFIGVDVDADGYAPMEACIRGGIAPWLTAESDTANFVPC